MEDVVRRHRDFTASSTRFGERDFRVEVVAEHHDAIDGHLGEPSLCIGAPKPRTPGKERGSRKARWERHDSIWIRFYLVHGTEEFFDWVELRSRHGTSAVSLTVTAQTAESLPVLYRACRQTATSVPPKETS